MSHVTMMRFNCRILPLRLQDNALQALLRDDAHNASAQTKAVTPQGTSAWYAYRKIPGRCISSGTSAGEQVGFKVIMISA